MLNKKIVFCTGINGQDGSYLAERLLEDGYKVHGLIRRSSLPNTGRITHIIDKITLETGDMTDCSNLSRLIRALQPTEIYNLAAQSDVKTSFTMQEFTAQTNAVGVLHILEAVKSHSPHTRVYQASTSELYGGKNVPITGYNEDSPFRPRSPYAVAKLYAYWMCRMYREAYGTFAANGILMNHESPRRGENFVTKKITSWCGRYKKSLHGGANWPGVLELGNLESFRDWGHAKDYIEAMILINRHSEPDDWVVATGETHSIREFVQNCFDWMNIKLEWQGSGLGEVGLVDGKKVIAISEEFFRPSEVDRLLGDSSKIRSKLGWKPKFSFSDLIDDMMTYEVN